MIYLFLLTLLLGQRTPAASPEAQISRINTKAQPSITTYLSESKTSPSEDHRYYLVERFEENRRIFSLFHSTNRQLQDLLWEKTFASAHTRAADLFRTKILQTYHLQTKAMMTEPQPDDPALVSTEIPLTDDPKAILWRADKEWSADWEKQYGQWVAEVLTPHFMVDIQLPTDCADVAYALRWIFAKIHKLPMAVHLGGSGQLFTNESIKQEWLKLPQDEDWRKDRRFRAALEYLLRNTYTHTLMSDSYPVALNPSALTPGAYHLSIFGASGHTMIVDSVNAPNNLPITLLYSTTPVKVRDLIATFYQSTETPELYKSGFYKIRWATKMGAAQWKILPAKTLPGYSEEQFHFPVDSENAKTPHFIKVYKKLNPDFSFQIMMQRSFEELQERVQDRIKIVEDGFNYCKGHDCAPGSAGDEDWSTPSRDSRLLELHGSLNLATDFLQQLEPQNYLAMREKVAKDSWNKVYLIEGQSYALPQITLALTHQLTKTDPRLSIAERWGLSPQGLSINMRKSALETLKLRAQLIAEAEVCRRQTCKIEGDNFKKYSTADMDLTLVHQWLGAQKLCIHHQPESCQQLREHLINYKYQDISLLEWLERAPLWISNPNSPMNGRWGQPGKTLLGSNGAKAFFSHDQKWFTFDRRLYETSSFSEVVPPRGQLFGQLHPKLPYYFTYEQLPQTLVVRFFEFPQQLISEKRLELPNDTKLKIWWAESDKKDPAGSNEARLAVFTNQYFYQLGLDGSILKKEPILRFTENVFDSRLIHLETNHGFFMTDIRNEAGLFVPVPWKHEDFSKLLPHRTQLGWLFQALFSNPRQFTYIEPSGILFDWEISSVLGGAYVTPDAMRVAKLDGTSKTIELYRREKSDTGLSHFVRWKNIPGVMFSGTAHYLTVYLGNQQTKIYSLDTGEQVEFPCANARGQEFERQMMSGNYYLCSSDEQSEIRDISGKLLHSDPLGGWWSFIDGEKQNLFIKSLWADERLRFEEVYILADNHLRGPIAQGLFSFWYSPLNLQLGNQRAEIAPVPLRPFEKTNFGIVITLHSPVSFILEATLNDNSQKPQNLLFLPQL